MCNRLVSLALQAEETLPNRTRCGSRMYTRSRSLDVALLCYEIAVATNSLFRKVMTLSSRILTMIQVL